MSTLYGNVRRIPFGRVKHAPYVNPATTVLRPALPAIETGQVQTSGQAHWVYIGQVLRAFLPKHVAFRVSTQGAGTQTCEVGLFSTASAPNKAAQNLLCLAASGTVTDLTTNGIKRNTSAFSTTIQAGVHLWAGIRIAMGTTQPAVRLVVADWSQGAAMFKAGAAVFSAGTSVSGTSISDTAMLMDLRVELQ